MSTSINAFDQEIYDSHVKEHGIEKTDRDLIEFVIRKIELNRKKEIVVFWIPEELNGRRITSIQKQRILIEIINRFRLVADILYTIKYSQCMNTGAIYYNYFPISSQQVFNRKLFAVI